MCLNWTSGSLWEKQIVVQWAFFGGFIDNTWAHLREREKERGGTFHPEFLPSRQTGPGGGWGVTPHSPRFFFSWSSFLIELLKILNYSSAALCYPNHFHWSGYLCWAPETFQTYSPSLSPLQDHQENQERDPQVLLAPLGLVALQVARVLRGWGDHQDPLDIATPLSVLAFLTMDKDTQVHSTLSRSCMVLQ